LAVCGAIWWSACTGTIIAPQSTVAPGSATATSCPKPDPNPPFPTPCANTVRLENVMLTCGGDGTIKYTVGRAKGGANLYTVFIPDGTNYTAKATPQNAACTPGIPINIGIFLGATYFGEQGEEPATPGMPVTPCVVRSRVAYSQFHTNDPLVTVFALEPQVKDVIHNELDKAIIQVIFGPTFSGRCARWQPLPV
jgi:hypothetical protein